jgi:hypothetical protein
MPHRVKILFNVSLGARDLYTKVRKKINERYFNTGTVELVSVKVNIN